MPGGGHGRRTRALVVALVGEIFQIKLIQTGRSKIYILTLALITRNVFHD